MTKWRKRRRERYEDKRLDWRDPNMPVIQRSGAIVAHERRHYAANVRMTNFMYNPGPAWQDDPTYNMRRKGK